MRDVDAPGRSPYGNAINRCVDYILTTPAENGYLGVRGGKMYEHSIATLFLSEVSGMVDPERQKKIDDALKSPTELLFEEAPLASPKIPLLRMTVPKWAVVARILWHAGYHPEIENYRRAKNRAARAADILMQKARADGGAALVAHGYFNLMIGRELRRRGFRKSGSHRAKFWNAVIYDMP